MSYSLQLQFFNELMKNLNLNTWTFSYDQVIPAYDGGLRDYLHPGFDYTAFFKNRIESMNQNTIYCVTDEFSCRYLYILLPPPLEGNVLVIGPYIIMAMHETDVLNIANNHKLPNSMFPHFFKYYTDLAYVSADNFLLAAVNTLGQHMWGSLNDFTLEYIKRSLSASFEPITRDDISYLEEDPFMLIHRLEERYHRENEMIQAISQGLVQKAEMFIFEGEQLMEQRVTDSVRNYKNYMIIANTLFRKAAESGGVHPIHIDSLSSKFAIKIEQLTSINDVSQLYHDMSRKYSMLVKNHSLKGYSLIIRKVITRIDSDLTADHSLKAQAELLNINASYLSSLFKKETGTTLTEYVNRKRIDHAVFLLNTTDMQIQSVAQYCGIPDVNYFTKTFKKYINKTPKEYRENLQEY